MCVCFDLFNFTGQREAPKFLYRGIHRTNSLIRETGVAEVYYICVMFTVLVLGSYMVCSFADYHIGTSGASVAEELTESWQREC